MIFNLGRSPMLSVLSDGLDFAAAFLSAAELRAAQAAVTLSEQFPTDERLAAAALSVQRARTEDSMNAKMARWAAAKILDALDAEAVRLDAAYPGEAPHSVILGPRFPRDDRPSKITGYVASISAGRIFDRKGLFGDAFWSSVPASARLQGRRLTALSGADKGNSYAISDHVLDAPAFIRLDGNPWGNGTHTGVKFSIDGDGIPDPALDRDERARDWLVSGAIQGTLTAAVGGVLTCAAIFNASGYWLDSDGDAIKGSLAGRTLLIGAAEYPITVHTPSLGRITVTGGGAIAGTEAFRIRARSPGETGRQGRGFLRAPPDGGRYSTLEPGTTVRLDADMLAQAEPANAAAIAKAMEAAARYAHARFQRWRGSRAQLRAAVAAHAHIIADARREAARVDDLRQMSIDLDLPLKFTS